MPVACDSEIYGLKMLYVAALASAGCLHIFYDAMFCFGLWRELMMLTSSMSRLSFSVLDRHGPPCALALEANATRQVLSEMSAMNTSLARLRRVRI